MRKDTDAMKTPTLGHTLVLSFGWPFHTDEGERFNKAEQT
jgi:hypothetical protein